MKFSETSHNDKTYAYYEKGEGPVILLLHGLLGTLSNWEAVFEKLSATYRVVMPNLPILEKGRRHNVHTLTDYLKDFTTFMKFESITLMGNSLGGHLALLYVLQYPENIKSLVLTGSSGLFENTEGIARIFPIRSNFEFAKKKTQETFYDPKIVGDDMVRDIMQNIGNIHKALCVVGVAKSAKQNHLGHRLKEIKTPTLLVWGLNDTITPPVVAHEFRTKIQHATLKFLDHCSHVPMMEHPEAFSKLTQKFLEKHMPSK